MQPVFFGPPSSEWYLSDVEWLQHDCLELDAWMNFLWLSVRANIRDMWRSVTYVIHRFTTYKLCIVQGMYGESVKSSLLEDWSIYENEGWDWGIKGLRHWGIQIQSNSIQPGLATSLEQWEYISGWLWLAVGWLRGEQSRWRVRVETFYWIDTMLYGGISIYLI